MMIFTTTQQRKKLQSILMYSMVETINICIFLRIFRHLGTGVIKAILRMVKMYSQQLHHIIYETI